MRSKNKRDLPLILIQKITEFIKNDKGSYPQLTPDHTYCIIEDRENNSDFYFEVFDASLEQNKVYFSVRQKPKSEISVEVTEYIAYSDEIYLYLKSWQTLVEAYSETPWFEDSITDQYEAEFYEEFDLVDEDADTHSFPTATQLWLDAYLEKVVKRLETYVGQNEEIGEIIEQVEDLRETQTKLT